MLFDGGVDYAIAIEWVEAALELALEGEETGSTNIKTMENLLQQIKGKKISKAKSEYLCSFIHDRILKTIMLNL